MLFNLDTSFASPVKQGVFVLRAFQMLHGSLYKLLIRFIYVDGTRVDLNAM